MTPYYEDEAVIIYHGDAREIVPPPGCVLVSDPPYPNNAGHFSDGIQAAVEYLEDFCGVHALVFWDVLARPSLSLPLVAVHVWHRTNTNRPNNFEPVYEYHADGVRRSSRVMRHAVIAEGLTGCFEATGHPTQKNVRLMSELIRRTDEAATVLDPFMGSGTTLRAAKDLGRKAIGIEIDERYCEIAARRMAQGVLDFGPAVVGQD